MKIVVNRFLLGLLLYSMVIHLPLIGQRKIQHIGILNHPNDLRYPTNHSIEAQVKLSQDSCRNIHTLYISYRGNKIVSDHTVFLPQNKKQPKEFFLLYKLGKDTFYTSATPTVSLICGKSPNWFIGSLQDLVSELNEDAVWKESRGKRNVKKRSSRKINPNIKEIPNAITEKFSSGFEDNKSTLSVQRENANSSIVIDKKEFEAFSYQTLSDVLRLLPGIYFDDNKEESPNLRGLGTAYTQVLIDGVSLPGLAENRSAAIDMIPADMIEKVIIIRNNDGTIDQQGIGGAINIVTKKNISSSGTQLRVSGGYTPVNSVNGNASLSQSGKLGKWSYTLKGNLQERAVIRGKESENINAYALNINNTDIQNTAFKEWSIMPQLNWIIDHQNAIRLNTTMMNSDGDKDISKTRIERLDSVLIRNGIVNQNQRQKRDIKNFSFNHEFNDKKRLALSNSLRMIGSSSDIHSNSQTILDQSKNLVDSTRNISQVFDNEIQINIKGKYRFSRAWQLSFGGDIVNKNRNIDREDYRNGFLLRGKIEELYTQKEFRKNLYFIHNFQLQKFSLNAGLRREYISQINEVQTYYITNLQRQLVSIDKGSQNGQWFPVFQLNYDLFKTNKLKKFSDKRVKKDKEDNQEETLLTENTKEKDFKNKKNTEPSFVIKPNYSRNIKRPSFNDLNSFVEYFDGTIDNPDKGGNPYLTPELSESFDIASEYYFANNKGVLSSNIFYRHITDMIIKTLNYDDNSSRYIEQPINIGKGNSMGLELDARYTTGIGSKSKANFRGNLTIPKTTFRNVDGQPKNVKNQPNYFFNIGSDLSFTYKRKISVGLNYTHYPSFEREVINGVNIVTTVQRSLSRCDGYLGIDFSKWMSLRLTVKDMYLANRNRDERISTTNGISIGSSTNRNFYRPTYQMVLVGNF